MRYLVEYHGGRGDVVQELVGQLAEPARTAQHRWETPDVGTQPVLGKTVCFNVMLLYNIREILCIVVVGYQNMHAGMFFVSTVIATSLLIKPTTIWRFLMK